MLTVLALVLICAVMTTAAQRAKARVEMGPVSRILYLVAAVGAGILSLTLIGGP